MIAEQFPPLVHILNKNCQCSLSTLVNGCIAAWKRPAQTNLQLKHFHLYSTLSERALAELQLKLS